MSVTGIQFIIGTNLKHSYFNKLEDEVAAYNAVRLIDVFIDNQELQQVDLIKPSTKAKTVRSMHHR